MDAVYLKIWELAKPYYLRGRSYDVPHIEWMMGEAEKIADKEHLDKQLLLPIVILHDVGYSAVGKTNPNIKGKETKIVHMREGAKIAEKILTEVQYAPELSKRIIHYIGVHDNWILGDDAPYKESKEMAVFNDLDFIWPQTSWYAFETTNKSMGMDSDEKSYNFWMNDEKLTRRPFSTPTTKELFYSLSEKRKNDIERRTHSN